MSVSQTVYNNQWGKAGTSCLWFISTVLNTYLGTRESASGSACSFPSGEQTLGCLALTGNQYMSLHLPIQEQTFWRGCNAQGSLTGSFYHSLYIFCLSSPLRHMQACFAFISTKHFNSETNLPFIYGNLNRTTLDERGLICPHRLYKCLFFSCFLSFCVMVVCFVLFCCFAFHTAILRRTIKPTQCMQTHFTVWAEGIRARSWVIHYNSSEGLTLHY